MSKSSGGTRTSGPSTGSKERESVVPAAARFIMDHYNAGGDYSSLTTQQRMAAWVEAQRDTPMSKEQEEAIQYYQSSGYLRIKMFLDMGGDVNGDSKNARMIRAIDSAFKPADKDILVYRMENTARDGSVSNGYVSTSVQVEHTHTFSYKDNAKVRAYLIPKGTPVIQRMHDQEVILPRNTDMRKYRVR